MNINDVHTYKIENGKIKTLDDIYDDQIKELFAQKKEFYKSNLIQIKINKSDKSKTYCSHYIKKGDIIYGSLMPYLTPIILDQIYVGIATLDQDANIIECNKKFLKGIL